MESRYDHWLKSLKPPDIVVTGSDRLARHLRERFAALQLAAGRSAWERPDILTIRVFANRLWQHCREQDSSLPELIPQAAERLLWESVTNSSKASAALLQPAAMARAAADAWKNLQAYPLPRQRLATVEKEDTVEFLNLVAAFEERLSAANQIAAAQLFSALAERMQEFAGLLPAAMHLVGLEEAPPDQQAFIAALESSGVKSHVHDELADERTVHRFCCDDADEEIRRAAAWAVDKLGREPDTRIGIVALDLEARREQLHVVLRETLAPDALPSFSDRDLPFNVSLGFPLSEVALVRDALDALALPDEPRPLSWIGRLLRSPYLFPGETIGRRSTLERRFRDSGYSEITSRHLHAAAQSEGLETFAVALGEFLELHAQERSKALPSEWARRFARQLGVLGWGVGRDVPDSRTLSSREFQARETFHEVLTELGGCDVLNERWERKHAVNELRRLTNDRLFQPRAADGQVVPVQVLGWLEATGLEFDALWVMGLEDTVLPAAPRPHPLVPAGLQREYDWPHSSAEREHAFAERQLRRLSRAADEVVLSYPQMEADRLLRPSPLLAGLDLAEIPPAIPRLAEHAVGSATLENVEDVMGPPILDDVVRGGTRFIEDQSACAFRAFAVHRLQAHDWPTPRPGPDPRLRGSLVHEALEALWERWQQRSVMAALADEDRLQAIREVAGKVVEDSQRKRPALWPQGLAALEVERLATLLDEWLGLERERADFAVIGREVNIEVQAGPLRMRGRIDRIDKLPEGELLIDYKTGGALGKSGWEGERPASPQLPLYAINRRQPPIGIAFGKLRAGESKFSGIAACDTGTAGIDDLASASGKNEIADWDDRLAEWRDVLARLGEEAGAGRAEPDPLPGACDYCHLHSLCRIDELSGEASALMADSGPESEAADAD